MYPRKVLGMIVLLCLAFVTDCYSQQASTSIEQGFVEDDPAIFTILNVGTTIKISAIDYALGSLISYNEEIAFEQQKSVLLKISTDHKLAATTRDYRYSVDINGKQTLSHTKEEWNKIRAKGYIGFSATGIGGVILRSADGFLSLNASTEFSYDDFGRRKISSQKFTHENISYEITYTDYIFDKHGRLYGYNAHIQKGK